MSRLPLTFAASEYAHFEDLTGGRIAVEGVDLNCFRLPIEEIFYRFTRFRNGTSRRCRWASTSR